MTDKTKDIFSISNLSTQMREASDEVEETVRTSLIPAAELIEESFARAAGAIKDSLADAAESGSLSFKKLSQSIASELAKVAIDKLIKTPLEGLMSGSVNGARASGGFIGSGQSYLVGEHGPEIFTPGSSGIVSPAVGDGSVTVNVNLSNVSDVQGFVRSETQLAAALSRALGRGSRNS